VSTWNRGTTAIALALTALVAAVAPARGQGAARRASPRPEGRIDYFGPDPHTLHAGAGLNLLVGTYLRVGLIAGGGATWQDGETRGSARAEVIGRFSFDPFRERRWGLSAGGGVSAQYDYDAVRRRPRWQALVTVILDLEGPRTGSLAPAVQVGLGGRPRIGLVLRAADPYRR
jgi:hypothetical protein